MASYLLRVQTIQRAAGRSAVAAAAYRAGERLVDDRLAMEFDFVRKGGVEFLEIRLPEGAPTAFADRAALWNAAEGAEARKDAVPAREILVALPHELTFEQRRALVRDFVDRQITARGMIADVALHKPGQEGDQRNYHAHILLTTRRAGPNGFGAKDTAWRTPQQVREWRESWADIQNEHLRRHLGPNAPQVSHLTLSEQGIDRVPGEHLGPAATAMERRDERTDRGSRNRDIDARNSAAERTRRDYSETADRLASAAPKVEASIEQLVAEARRVRDGMTAERDAWRAEADGLKGVRAPSEKAVEREVLAADEAALRHARLRLANTENRVSHVRRRRLELEAWIRNPARMIWAKHAELNALSRARRVAREAELRVALRRQWLASPAGQSWVASRRQPDLDQAADAARKRRTLVRKIKRMDRRIDAATRTVNDLVVAQELGQARLRVPAHSPDPIRFIRDVGAPAREAVSRFPAPARAQAIERLNRGQGRSIVKTLFPGR